MKYTLNSKNASHISDIMKKTFKPDMNIHIQSNYGYGMHLLTLGSDVYILNDRIRIAVCYYDNNGINTENFYIPFGSKIEMKGSLINVSIKKPSYMRNEILSFFIIRSFIIKFSKCIYWDNKLTIWEKTN